LLFNGSDVGRTLARRVAPEIKAIQIVHILIDQELKAHSLNFQEQQAIYRVLEQAIYVILMPILPEHRIE